MKSILFVAPCLSFAGAEKILYWVATELGIMGYDTHILNLNLIDNNALFERDDSNKKVSIHTCPNQFRKGLNNAYRIRSIMRVIDSIDAGIIVPFTRYPCIISVLAGKLKGVPVVISERGDPYQYARGIKNKVENMVLNQADGCVFQTSNAKKAYGKKLQRKSVIISNPIFLNEPIKPKSQSDRSKTIVSVGRLDNKQKRYDIMLESFRIFFLNHKNYRLVIYGKGPDEEQIKSWANQTGISYAIEFRGLTQHACRDINDNGIFLITSDFEGIPNALLEAMAVGMPVVSTDCSPGGAAMLIRDHENGLLTPVGNVTEIANALSLFADDQLLAKRCGENARKVLTDYAPDNIIKQWEKYLNTYLKI